MKYSTAKLILTLVTAHPAKPVSITKKNRMKIWKTELVTNLEKYLLKNF